MRKFFASVVSFLQAEDGPTAVEYAVMLAMIILVCFVAVALVGTKTSNMIANQLLQNALGGS